MILKAKKLYKRCDIMEHALKSKKRLIIGMSDSSTFDA